MKGWPFLRALLTLAALLLVAVPLRRLTAPPLAQGPVDPLPQVVIMKPPVLPESVRLVLTFTHPPEKFVLKSLGQEVMSGQQDHAFAHETQIELRYPPEGVDFVLEAAWTEHFRKVGASLEVVRADGTTQTQTVWGLKKIEEVLTFPGTEGKN